MSVQIFVSTLLLGFIIGILEIVSNGRFLKTIWVIPGAFLDKWAQSRNLVIILDFWHETILMNTHYFRFKDFSIAY